MHTILRGDLVEILSNPGCPTLLGLVMNVHALSGKIFFEVRYTAEGHSDTRWINETFLRKA